MFCKVETFMRCPVRLRRSPGVLQGGDVHQVSCKLGAFTRCPVRGRRLPGVL